MCIFFGPNTLNTWSCPSIPPSPEINSHIRNFLKPLIILTQNKLSLSYMIANSQPSISYVIISTK